MKCDLKLSSLIQLTYRARIYAKCSRSFRCQLSISSKLYAVLKHIYRECARNCAVKLFSSTVVVAYTTHSAGARGFSGQKTQFIFIIFNFPLILAVECWQRCGLWYCNFRWLAACWTDETGKMSKPHCPPPAPLIGRIDRMTKIFILSNSLQFHSECKTASLATTLCTGHMGKRAAQGSKGKNERETWNLGNLNFKREKFSFCCYVLFSYRRLSMALLKYTKERIPKSTHIRCFGITKSSRTHRWTRSWKRRASPTSTFADSPMMFASVGVICCMRERDFLSPLTANWLGKLIFTLCYLISLSLSRC